MQEGEVRLTVRWGWGVVPKKATQVLGILPENLLLYNYEVRTFSYNRQAILQDLIDYNEQIC